MIGFRNFKTIAAAATLAASVASLGTIAEATTSTAVCPGSGAWDRYFSLTVDLPTTVACETWGANNDSNDPAFRAFLQSYYALPDPFKTNDVLLNKIESVNGSITHEGSHEILRGTDVEALLGGTGGSFALDLSGFRNVLIAFKTGQGNCTGNTDATDAREEGRQCNPAFAVFSINGTEIRNGTWSVNLSQGLSHVSLYGTPAPIPLPAAGWLLLGGLGAFATVGRRRKIA